MGQMGLTDDGNGLPGKTQSAPDAHILAAAACRPEADHVLCPKEHHQDNLLWKEADELSPGCDSFSQTQAPAVRCNSITDSLEAYVADCKCYSDKRLQQQSPKAWRQQQEVRVLVGASSLTGTLGKSGQCFTSRWALGTYHTNLPGGESNDLPAVGWPVAAGPRLTMPFEQARFSRGPISGNWGALSEKPFPPAPSRVAWGWPSGLVCYIGGPSATSPLLGSYVASTAVPYPL